MNDEAMKNTAGTPERLLLATARLMAEHGRDNFTVRDICREAESNVAAVNYHFGGKNQLINAVINKMVEELKTTVTESLNDNPHAKPKERLFNLIRGMLFRRLDPNRPEWKTRILHQELMNPSSNALELLSELIRKEQQILDAIIQSVLGADSTPELRRRCSYSIFGQMFFYFHLYGPHFRNFIKLHRPGFKKIMDQLETFKGEAKVSIEEIEAFATHVTHFSLAAMNALKSTESETVNGFPSDSNGD